MTTITTQLADALRALLKISDMGTVLSDAEADEYRATEKAAIFALAAYDAQQPTTLSDSEKQDDHTPEPWRAGAAPGTIGPHGSVDRFIRDASGAIIACVSEGTIVQARANARRIVACVNACAGIQTEALERDNVRAIIRNVYEA